MCILKEIKDSWGWVGIEPSEIVEENLFGNLVIKDAFGRFWRLCPEDVYCEVIAENKEELDKLAKDPEFLQDWHMHNLVEEARKKYGELDIGYKYCLVVPGTLGGEYAANNIGTAPLMELIRFSGHIAKQIKDLPDGAQIELKLSE